MATDDGNIFNIPKRNVGNNAFDNKKRKFANKNFVRPIKPNADFEELVREGIFSDLSLGSKNCFYVKELQDDQKAELERALNVSENMENQLIKKFEKTEDGAWWTVVTETSEGSSPSTHIAEAIDLYHSFTEENAENKNCLTMYGNMSFKIDFSKLNLVEGSDNGIKYPYGAFFFSDSKSSINQFSASCILNKNRVAKTTHNVSYIKNIEDWSNVEFSGSFRTKGHAIVFYVSEEETDKEDIGLSNESAGIQFFDGNYPKVNIIHIEFVLNRKKDGVISGVGINKVEKFSVFANGKKADAFGSEVDYLVKDVFAKYAKPGVSVSRFAGDYIYLLGDSPKYYDLTILRDDNDERAKSFDGDKDKKADNPSKTKSYNQKKPSNKKGKKNKKDEVEVKDDSAEKENDPKEEVVEETISEEKVETESETPVDVQITEENTEESVKEA